MSYSAFDLVYYNLPSFYEEEIMIPVFDDDMDVPAEIWLMKGYHDLTSFWSACSTYYDVCTISDYTTTDYDGSYISFFLTYFEGLESTLDLTMICFADSNCFVWVAFSAGNVYPFPFATQFTGTFSATDPDPGTTTVTSYSDEEEQFGFDYPDWLATDYDPIRLRGGNALQQTNQVNSFWYLTTSDTDWVIGSDITVWTGYEYSAGSGPEENRSYTFTLGGASTLALASSVVGAAAAILF